MLRAHKIELMRVRLALGLGKIEETTLVFGNMEGRLRSPHAVSRAWTRFLDANGLPRIIPCLEAHTRLYADYQGRGHPHRQPTHRQQQDERHARRIWASNRRGRRPRGKRYRRPAKMMAPVAIRLQFLLCCLRKTRNSLKGMVGAGRFELPTPGPPDRCANRAALRSDVSMIRELAYTRSGLGNKPKPSRFSAIP
jgi:hypothetical protein